MEFKTVRVADRSGNVMKSADVRVYRANTTTEVTVFDEDGVALTTSQLKTDANGAFGFKTFNGVYDIVASLGSTTATIQNVQFNDPPVYATVAAFAADVTAGYTAPDGTVVSTGPVKFQADSSAAIDGLPAGWTWYGDLTPLHYADNTTPGTTDMTSALLAALQSGAPKVVVPDGIFLIETQIIATLAGNLHLVIKGTIKGSDNATWADDFMIRLDAVINTRYNVTLEGPGTIDASLRTNNPGVASGSGILVRYADNLLVHGGLKFFAGTAGDGKGDSGLVPEYCHRVTVDGCFFDGWDDHDIYFTGGADPVTAQTEGESAIVTNCHFLNNLAGSIRIARDYKRVIIDGNIARNVGKLVVAAGGASNFISAERITVTNNIIDVSKNIAIDLRYSNPIAATIVAGNQIYDWGMDVEGPAINLRGVSNAAVYGNVIKPGGSTPTATSCSTGVYMIGATGDDGVLYASADNYVFGNIIEVTEGGTRSNNACVVDNTGGTNSIGYNLTINASPFDVNVKTGGTDTTVGEPLVVRHSSNGIGYGGAVARVPLEVASRFIVSRSDTPERYLDFDMDSSTLALLKNVSPESSGRNLAIDSRTDTGAAPSIGTLDILMRINGITRFRVKSGGIALDGVQTFADNAAALSGGLVANDVYTTATGELRIVV